MLTHNMFLKATDLGGSFGLGISDPLWDYLKQYSWPIGLFWDVELHKGEGGGSL